MKPKSNLKFVDPRYSYSLSLPHGFLSFVECCSTKSTQDGWVSLI